MTEAKVNGAQKALLKITSASRGWEIEDVRNSMDDFTEVYRVKVYWVSEEESVEKRIEERKIEKRDRDDATRKIQSG